MKNNFFRTLWNFLAAWAGILVTIFLGIEVWEMAKTFATNIKSTFEVVTDGGVVLPAMVLALVFAVAVRIFKREKTE